MHELSSNALVYVYVVATTLALFVVIGRVLGRKEDELRECASTDPLTNLPNRRPFELGSSKSLSRARASSSPTSLLIVDMDDLKSINDSGGHSAGDEAIRLVASCLAKTCRSRDLAARFGGDEFVVLAPWTNGDEAMVLANRIRASLREVRLASGRSVSVSIGVADTSRTGSLRSEALFGAADEALYVAKANGRNRAVLSRPVNDTWAARSPADSTLPVPATMG